MFCNDNECESTCASPEQCEAFDGAAPFCKLPDGSEMMVLASDTGRSIIGRNHFKPGNNRRRTGDAYWNFHLPRSDRDFEGHCRIHSHAGEYFTHWLKDRDLTAEEAESEDDMDRHYVAECYVMQRKL